MSWLPVAVRKVLPGWRDDTPEAFLLDGRPPGTKTVVACLGDSITQGQISANYVNLLRARFGPAGSQSSRVYPLRLVFCAGERSALVAHAVLPRGLGQPFHRRTQTRWPV